jgi:hypothetical protein
MILLKHLKISCKLRRIPSQGSIIGVGLTKRVSAVLGVLLSLLWAWVLPLFQFQHYWQH